MNFYSAPDSYRERGEGMDVMRLVKKPKKEKRSFAAINYV